MTDISEVHWYVDIFRDIFAALDKMIYDLLAGMFNIFYMVAGAEIQTGQVVQNFFSRIQIILGVIIVFKLVIALFSGIVDPDSLNDQKKGVGNVIKRVVVVLVMFILIVPLNIPEESTSGIDQKNSMMTWNERMNQSGILFGTLYELQSRVLKDDIIQNVILGTKNTKKKYNTYSTSGDIISTYLLQSFLVVNLQEGAEDYTDSSNWMCHGHLGDEEENLKKFVDMAYDPDSYTDKFDISYENIRSYLLNNVNKSCKGAGNAEFELKWYHIVFPVTLIGEGVSEMVGWSGERYFFVYHYLLSTIAGVLFTIMILSLTIDIAVRVFKLALLRLISPVAILSYIDPKSEKTFNNWVKTLSTTYLDLFIRVAVVSFIMLFIRILPSVEFNIPGNAVMTLIAHIILDFGLLFFAKEAPKFISETLGIDSKGNMGLFSGIGKLRAGTAAIGGIASGAVSNAVATRANGGNMAKSTLSFLTGGIGGGVNASKEFFKDGSDASSIKNATRRYNQQNYERAADESTVIGRAKAGWQERLGLQNDYEKMNTKIKYYEAAGSAMDRINNAFNGNGAYKFQYNNANVANAVRKALGDRGIDQNTIDKYIKQDGTITDANGNVIIKSGTNYTLKDMNDILGRVTATGDNTLINAVDEAKKSAQGTRLNQIRKFSREQIVEWVNDETNLAWSSNDLNAFDAATTIYEVSQKYSGEPEFQLFNGKKFDDPSLGWGAAFKNSASKAKATADATKNSPAYTKAQKNAQRSQEKNNK